VYNGVPTCAIYVGTFGMLVTWKIQGKQQGTYTSVRMYDVETHGLTLFTKIPVIGETLNMALHNKPSTTDHIMGNRFLRFESGTCCLPAIPIHVETGIIHTHRFLRYTWNSRYI
jgi:hypothetical protein